MERLELRNLARDALHRTTRLVAALAAAILVAATVGSRATADPLFAAPFYSLWTSPSQLAIADLNNDGRPDLVEPTQFAVYVQLGTGPLTFGPLIQVADLRSPVARASGVAVADVNGDGRQDIIVTGFASNLIYVLLGNGDGTFQPWVAYPVGNGPTSVAVGDLNHDGRLDLVSANQGAGSVTILLGHGDGTFGSRLDAPTGGSPWSLTLADLDGDGNLDIVAATPSDTVVSTTLSVLLGRGDGTFAPYVEYQCGGSSAVVAVADLDGDGKPDLVAQLGGVGVGSLAVLRGLGGGAFGPPALFPSGAGPGLVLGDFNRDGKVDAVTSAPYDSSTVSVQLGNGDGTFGPPTTFDTACGATWLTAADLTGNGFLSLVTKDFGVNSGSVSILPGRGDGTFGFRHDVPTGKEPYALVVRDFNGDGLPDLATADNGDSAVAISMGRGLGAFAPAVEYRTGAGPAVMVAGDLNGDGHLDLVTGNANTISILLGNGDGTFRPRTDLGIAIRAYPPSLAFGDLNGDGKLDLVYGSSGEVVVMLGNGDGTFGAPDSFPTSGPTSIAIGDMNGDGKADLVVGFVDSVSVLLGKGDGTFGPHSDFAATYYPYAIALADLNGDGKLDVVTAEQEARKVTVLLGNGDGTLRPKTDYVVNYYPISLAIADLDGDGKPDIAAANWETFTVSVLLGNGDGTFKTASNIGTRPFPTAVAVGDFNGDGRPDLAVASEASNTVTLLFNSGGALTLDVTPPAITVPSVEFSARPNPMSTGAHIAFVLPSAGEYRLRVFDAAGRLIATPAHGTASAGRHEVRWDARADSGAPVRPGVYLIELRAGGARVAKRIVVLR